MGNTEFEGNMEVLETAEETTAEKKQEEKKEETQEKKQKKRKSRKNRYGIRVLLLLLQHIALMAMVFSIFVVTVCSTVRISGVHSDGTYVSYTGYSDPGKPYEESDLFNEIFGYAAADIVRFGVVSSQLETGGVFDGDKVVDVTAYNYRDGGLPEQYVTASYRLEDLLKWNGFGFEYSSVEMTEKEAAEFLAETTRVTKVDPTGDDQTTTSAGDSKSDVKTVTSVRDVSAAEEMTVEIRKWDDDSGFVEDYQPIGELSQHAETGKYAVEAESPADTVEYSVNAESEDGTEVRDYDVLVNRYKTVEGKNLEDYAASWDQYYELCENVQHAAESLSYNYQEYMQYQDYYSIANSNVRYLIEKTVGEEKQYYSNMEEGSSYRKRVLQMMENLASDGKETKLPVEKFFYYCPGDMSYVTNTAIGEDTVRQIIQGYEYAYPETVKIWIGVDTSYPAKDTFTRAADYLPNLWQWVASCIIAGILYLVLFIYQTVVTGREYAMSGEKRIRLNAFDRIPTEAAMCIALGVGLLVVWIAVVVMALVGVDPTDVEYLRDKVHEEWLKVTLLAGAFAADMLFTFFFYSLVRRIKARTLWKNSYLCRIVGRLKAFAWKVYDNGSIVLRTWIPYGIYLLFNFLVLTLAWRDGIALLFAGIVDILVGILLYKDAKERQEIVESIETIAGGQVEHQIDAQNLHGDNRILANSVNSIGKGIQEAVEISMKDERMKADLITNVSHDIKTPLTSIINYVDLLKREQVESEKAQGYIRVLDEKSQRLKQLTDDLVEASKITSGNISLHFERINLTELMNQTLGEFSEKFDEKGLVTVMNVNTRNVVIEADSRRIWRVMENLFNNVYKYAMPGTRVYVTMEQGKDEGTICVTIKNISENYLNCRPEELTERFIRGDESRTTEGSGLGLSIAKNLTIAQKGNFEIELDGDLFKVILNFPLTAEQD